MILLPTFCNGASLSQQWVNLIVFDLLDVDQSVIPGVEIKDRRIFHDISVYASHVKTGVIFGVMPSKKNNSLVTPDRNHDS